MPQIKRDRVGIGDARLSALDEGDQTQGEPVLKFVRSEGRRWQVAHGKGQGGALALN